MLSSFCGVVPSPWGNSVWTKSTNVLGVGRFVPVGYSMGGAVAQLVWRRHNDRVAGMVLGATAAVFSASVRERVLSGLLPAASVAGRVAPSLAGRFVGSTLRARFAGSPWAGWADAELVRHQPAVMLAWAAALGRFSSASWIGSSRACMRRVWSRCSC